MSEPLDTQSPIPPRLGLDENDDPVIENLTREWDQALVQMTPLRHVDWRRGPKPCNKAQDTRAAYAQRVGIILPEDESCDKCRSSLGPFSSCCVVLIAGKYLFGGACANCSFLHTGSKCSLRRRRHFTPFMTNALQAANSSSTEVLPSQVTTGPQSGQTGHKRSVHIVEEEEKEKEEENEKKTRRSARVLSQKNASRPASTSTDSQKSQSAPKKSRSATKKSQTAPKKSPRPPLTPFSSEFLWSPLQDERFNVDPAERDWEFYRSVYNHIPEMIDRLQDEHSRLEEFLSENNQFLVDDDENLRYNPFF